MIYFNPRSPHGERHTAKEAVIDAIQFQSTLPARGATVPHRVQEILDAISIHAPRTGSDAFPCLSARAYSNFNPRSPHGERRAGCRYSRNYYKAFQSTLPARGATVHRVLVLLAENISIHAPRTGSDKTCPEPSLHTKEFQSTLPARGATDTFVVVPSSSVIFQSTLPARGATCMRIPRFFRRGGFQSTLPARGATDVP